nr:MAG TPA: hypothetical protein [Caudoviricetes sp.]
MIIVCPQFGHTILFFPTITPHSTLRINLLLEL